MRLIPCQTAMVVHIEKSCFLDGTRQHGSFPKNFVDPRCSRARRPHDEERGQNLQCLCLTKTYRWRDGWQNLRRRCRVGDCLSRDIQHSPCANKNHFGPNMVLSVVGDAARPSGFRNCLLSLLTATFQAETSPRANSPAGLGVEESRQANIRRLDEAVIAEVARNKGSLGYGAGFFSGSASSSRHSLGSLSSRNP